MQQQPTQLTARIEPIYQNGSTDETDEGYDGKTILAYLLLEEAILTQLEWRSRKDKAAIDTEAALKYIRGDFK